MSLAMLLYPPPTDDGLQQWVFHNLQHHKAIINGLASARGVNATLFQIWPLQKENAQDWLRQHQFQHSEMCSALGIPGADLSRVDFQEQQQFDAWIWIHFLEHQAAASALGMGI